MAYLYWEDYQLPAFSVSKTRSQPNPRTETDVFDGPLRVELKTDPSEVPATFDCSLICKTQQQTTAVGAFFYYINVNNSMLFYKDLPTEYGIQKHLVRITGGIPQPDTSATGRNEMMKYSFTLYVEKVVVPDSIATDPMLYIKFNSMAKILDSAINDISPEA